MTGKPDSPADRFALKRLAKTLDLPPEIFSEIAQAQKELEHGHAMLSQLIGSDKHKQLHEACMKEAVTSGDDAIDAAGLVGSCVYKMICFMHWEQFGKAKYFALAKMFSEAKDDKIDNKVDTPAPK
jgi:hypothetical protein